VQFTVALPSCDGDEEDAEDARRKWSLGERCIEAG